MIEKWRPIPGLDGYEASDGGRIRSHKARNGPVILSLRKNSAGYVTVGLRKNKASKTCLVHRLVATAWVGPEPKNRPCVAHLDGVRDNNIPSNLKWVSYKENESHKTDHGTIQNGSKNRQSVLTEANVLSLRKMYCDGASLNEISRQFGISVRTSADICYNKYWRSVDRTPQDVIDARRAENARVQWFKLNRALMEKPNENG